MSDLFKPTFLRVGIPHNRVRPPTSILPPTESAGAPTAADGCTSYKDDTSTTHDWTIPPGALPGALVVAFVNIRDGAVDTLPTGWTQLGTSANADSNAYVYARKLDGSEDYTDTFTTTSAGAFKLSAQWVYVQKYAGVVADVDFAGSTASTNNPPAVTASVPGDHWVFTAILGNKGLPNTTAEDDVPSGYTFQCYTGFTASSSGNPRVYSARRLVTIATTEDPGAFNYNDGGAGGRVFYLVTLAVPAGAFDPEVAPFDHDHVEADITDLAHVVTVAKAGTLVGTRSRINFIEGTNVTLGVVDDAAGDEIDVTITAAGGGGGGGTAPEWISYLAARQADETADADDDFFDDATKTGYTELAVTGTATWTELRDRMAVKALSGATGDASVALKSITATGPPLTIETAVMPDLVGSDFNLYGICFTDGTVAASNVVWVAMLARASGANNIQVATGTLTAINGSSKVSFSNTSGNHRGLTYFRLVQTASNTWAANYSTNGVTWHDMALAPFSFTMTPTHFGLFVAQHNSTTVPLMASGESLRMDEADRDV